MLTRAPVTHEGRPYQSFWSQLSQRLALLSPARLLVAGYLTLIAVGTAALSLPAAVSAPPRLSFSEALFTATSAVCVTGLTVVDTGTRLSRFGQVVVLVLIQTGGLGIMTMSTVFAVLLGRRITLRNRLLIQEELRQDYLSGLVRLARMVAGVTFTFEAVGAVLLFIAWADRLPLGEAVYYAVFHSISAFNNAGFDLWGSSLTGFVDRPLVLVTVMALFMTGGIGFAVLADVLSWHRGHRFQLHTRVALAMAGLLVLIAWPLLTALEWSNPSTLGGLPVWNRFVAGLFTAVTPRTAGFSVVPTGDLHPASLLVILVLMFIGVSPGSTGGGIKTTTAAVIGATVVAALRGQEDLILFERRLPRGTVQRAVALAVLAGMWVIVASAVVVALEPFDPLASVFEVVSAFGTVGLSRGITPELSLPTRFLLVATMLLGKVGPVTLAAALARRSQAAAHWRFPEERINLG